MHHIDEAVEALKVEFQIQEMVYLEETLSTPIQYIRSYLVLRFLIVVSYTNNVLFSMSFIDHPAFWAEYYHRLFPSFTSSSSNYPRFRNYFHFNIRYLYVELFAG